MAYDEHKHVTAMSVKMHAKINQNDDGTLHGELSSKYFEEPFIFTNLMSMIEMMETTFDTKGFPEKQLLPRTFGKAKQRLRKHELDLPAFAKEHSTVKEIADTQEQHQPHAKTCNFEISVRFRHNAEWQGSVKWIEKDETKRFTSIIELVRQINEALAE